MYAATLTLALHRERMVIATLNNLNFHLTLETLGKQSSYVAGLLFKPRGSFEPPIRLVPQKQLQSDENSLK